MPVSPKRVYVREDMEHFVLAIEDDVGNHKQAIIRELRSMEIREQGKQFHYLHKRPVRRDEDFRLKLYMESYAYYREQAP
jgi:hypothetical protein